MVIKCKNKWLTRIKGIIDNMGKLKEKDTKFDISLILSKSTSN